MTIIRVSGFIIALAAHGLLLAVVPTSKAIDLTSGASNTNNITLSISYHENSNGIDERRIDDASQYRFKQNQLKQLIEKPDLFQSPAVQESTDKLPGKSLSHTVISEQQDLKKTKKDISSISTKKLSKSAPTKKSQQGIHDTIITEPLFSSLPIPPQYPRLARSRGQQGTVWVDVVLDEKGQQTRSEIYKSSGVSPLDRAALEAVRRWQFIAHKINNVAVASYIRIPVEFSLD